MTTAKVSPRLRGWSTTSLMGSARLVEIMLRPPTTLAVNEYDNSSNCFNLLYVSFYASLSIYAGVNTPTVSVSVAFEGTCIGTFADGAG
jgi:hypothetical protein